MSIFLNACNGIKDNEFRISGSLNNGENKTIYLYEMTTEGFLPLDTIDLDKEGNFEIKMKYIEDKIFIIESSEFDYITLIPRAKEDVKIQGNLKNLSRSYSVQNSSESQILHDLNQEYIMTNDVLKEMSLTLHDNKFSKNIEDVKKQVFEQYNILEIRQKEIIKGFLNKNEGSLTSIIALYRKFDNHYLFSLKTDLDIYEDVYNKLHKTMPKNPHTLGLKNLIDVAKRKKQENIAEKQNEK